MIKRICMRFVRGFFSILIVAPVSSYVGGLTSSPVLKMSLTGATIMAAGKATREWIRDSKYEKFMSWIPF